MAGLPAPYSIRQYRADDARMLAKVCQSAILTIGASAYSNAQIEAWAARHPGAENIEKRVDEGVIINVATGTGDFPVAYSLLEPDGHLDHLYCHPDHSRRGLADNLLQEAEAFAKLNGIERLFTEASELARPAFQRAGYVVTKRRNFTIDHDGQRVHIHNYAMNKPLA